MLRRGSNRSGVTSGGTATASSQATLRPPHGGRPGRPGGVVKWWSVISHWGCANEPVPASGPRMGHPEGKPSETW